jgi:hypothetical protein
MPAIACGLADYCVTGGWIAGTGSLSVEARVGVARCAAAITTAVMLAGTLGCRDHALDPLIKVTTLPYDLAVSFQFNNGDSTSKQNPYLSVLGEMTFVINDGNGDVHGTYSYEDHPNASGTFTGSISPDGTITVRQFGDPNRKLGATQRFLYNNWPNCDFARATPMQFNAFLDQGIVSLVGTLTVPCTYMVDRKRVTVATTMIEALNAGPAADTSGMLTAPP